MESMDTMQWILVGSGGLLLLGSIGSYLRDTTKFVFPLALALIGAFLLAADHVSASLPGGAEFTLTKELKAAVDQSSTTADELLDASQKNSAALEEINKAFSASQEAFAAYQAEVNERFAALDEPPVPTPQFQINSSAISQAIRDANQANTRAKIESDELRELTKKVQIGG